MHKKIFVSMIGLLLLHNNSFGGNWFTKFFSDESYKKDDIIRNIRAEKYDDLKDKKVIITCKNAPNHDVPSFGFGDAFLYLIRLYDYLEKKGMEVAICPPSPLMPFFKKCSDLNVITDTNNHPEYTPVDCVEFLDNIKDFHTFECKKRFLGNNCTDLNKEATDLAKKMKKSGIIPILITRQSSTLPGKYATNPKFEYMNHRSISRNQLGAMVDKFLQERKKSEQKPKNIFARLFACFNIFSTPKKIRFYNIQFEDQKQPDIPGVEKPDTIYPQYKERRGAFVNDLVFMKAALHAGGRIVSVDTAAGNVAIGVPSADDTRKNIKFLLAEKYNSRWKGKFVNNDGSSTWSKNVDLIKQKRMDDWSHVGNELIKDFKELEGIKDKDDDQK